MIQYMLQESICSPTKLAWPRTRWRSWW